MPNPTPLFFWAAGRHHQPMNPTLEEFKKRVSYDPETGRITRLQANGQSKIAGSINYKGYRVVALKRKTYKAHRVAWLFVHGEWPREQIDHINGVRDDNRIANLREASHWLNAQNIRKPHRDSASGLLGVGVALNGRWVAKVVHRGETAFCKSFTDKHEAHAAYLVAKRAAHEACTV